MKVSNKLNAIRVVQCIMYPICCAFNVSVFVMRLPKFDAVSWLYLVISMIWAAAFGLVLVATIRDWNKFD